MRYLTFTESNPLL